MNIVATRLQKNSSEPRHRRRNRQVIVQEQVFHMVSVLYCFLKAVTLFLVVFYSTLMRTISLLFLYWFFCLPLNSHCCCNVFPPFPNKFPCFVLRILFSFHHPLVQRQRIVRLFELLCSLLPMLILSDVCTLQPSALKTTYVCNYNPLNSNFFLQFSQELRLKSGGKRKNSQLLWASYSYTINNK